MSRSDPLLLLADIVQVASERPDLDPVLVQVLYRHLVTTRRRHPTIQQARDYIDDLTSRLDEETLWRSLGLAAPGKVSTPAPLTPRRGRPKGTRSVPKQQIIGQFRALRTNYGRNPTQAELAANLKPRIMVRTLKDHLADYGLAWPIE